MKKYLAISKILFKSQIIWRFSIIFNMLFTITKILFAYILWGTIFSDKDIVSGFTFDAMLSYYIVSSFLSQIEMSDGVSGEISSRIRDGSFSKYMVIPVNIEGHFLAQNAGVIAFYALFNFIAAIVWIFIFHIKFVFTTDIVTILRAALICILGLIFMIELNFFLGILTLKFQDIGLFLMIKNNMVAFVTGAMIPLTLLPNAIIQIMRFFPFYYITYLPSMLLIGKNSGEAAIGIITLSGWVIAFKLINHVTYNRLRVRYDGVGI